jgi:hypothetical protein
MLPASTTRRSAEAMSSGPPLFVPSRPGVPSMLSGPSSWQARLAQKATAATSSCGLRRRERESRCMLKIGSFDDRRGDGDGAAKG